MRLRVSLAESIRRAQADPHRAATGDPAVVAAHYERIDWDALPAVDATIDTDGLSADDVVARIAARIGLP